MIKDAILSIKEQLKYEPKIENASSLKQYETFIVCGMGGSHLAADILKSHLPSIDILVHKNYGLPFISEDKLKKILVIISSYSGNTEEVIDSFEMAREKGLSLAVISTGGVLLDRAKKQNLPYIQLPKTGIQPRSALGFSMKALLAFMGAEQSLKEISALAKTFSPEKYEAEGKVLAEGLKGFVPLIYVSEKNKALAYNWKIKFNEGAKIPSFYSIFPEVNHNEMTGFDAVATTRPLSEKFGFIFLKDSRDDARIIERMEVTSGMYKKRGLRVREINIQGESIYERMFSSLALADWVAYYLSEQYGTEPEQVPMVEEFKGLITDAK